MKKRYSKSKSNLVTGKIRIHPRGFGFVHPDDPRASEDIFVPAKFMKGAVDGDTVQVDVDPHVSAKGPEGKIVSIVERGRANLMGIVEQKAGDGYLLIAPILGKEKRVHLLTKKKLQKGDRVFVRVKDWKGKKDKIQASFVKYIGAMNSPKEDILAALLEYQIPEEFPKDVLAEMETFPNEVTEEDKKGRKDFTSLTTITIDPTTAKDYDDALSLEIDAKGHYHLGVHIADVAHYIKQGSALDIEAALRGNSTYFPGTCVPMIPEKLSNHLCSLKPNVDRLTVSIVIQIAPNGDLIDYQVYRSVIQSKRRFTYEEVSAILLQQMECPHYELLKHMATLGSLLKKKRVERGSIDFAIPEVAVEVDNNGEPLGMVVREYDISHQLVEEFMLKANELIAKYLDKKEKGLIFRIHEKPDAENLVEFCNLAEAAGFALPANPSQSDLQKFFEEIKPLVFGKNILMSFIRSMKLAIYSSKNVGHYGLALEHYCHFTSPIRRYSDLIAERLLFDEEDPDMDLEAISQKCSSQERNSFRAESSVILLKKYRLLKKEVAKGTKTCFEAIISKIKPFGISFFISDFFIEGFIHVSDLGDEYFYFNEDTQSFEGQRTKKSFAIGTSILVTPLHIDLIFLESAWAMARTKKFRT